MNAIALENALEGASISPDDLSAVIDGIRAAKRRFLAAMRMHEDRRNQLFAEMQAIELCEDDPFLEVHRKRRAKLLRELHEAALLANSALHDFERCEAALQILDSLQMFSLGEAS